MDGAERVYQESQEEMRNTEEESYVETGMDTAKMWQPARFTMVHGNDVPFPETRSEAEKMIIRVRESDITPHLVRTAYPGCDATKCYEVHPADAAKLYGYNVGTIYVCEHEILTD